MSTELVVIEAEKFFSHRRVHDLLESWGEQLRAYDGVVPEAWGWPDESCDFSNQAASTNPTELTVPEACIDRLRHQGGNIETIHRMVSALALIPRVTLELRYVERMEDEDIGLQIGASTRVVEQSLSAGRNAVRRALVTLRVRVVLRRNGSGRDLTSAPHQRTNRP